MAVKQGLQRLALLGRKIEPFHRLPEIEEASQRPDLALDVEEVAGALLDLGDIGIADRLDALHARDGRLSLLKLLADEQRAASGDLIERRAHPLAIERVTALEVVVEER
jgi:hypothetical protein